MEGGGRRDGERDRCEREIHWLVVSQMLPDWVGAGEGLGPETQVLALNLELNSQIFSVGGPMI